jgi:uncharacterized protein
MRLYHVRIVDYWPVLPHILGFSTAWVMSDTSTLATYNFTDSVPHALHLLATYPDVVKKPRYWNVLIKDLAEYNQLNTLQALLSYVGESKVTLNDLFAIACWYNAYDTAKWLHSTFDCVDPKDYIDYVTYNEALTKEDSRLATWFGHLVDNDKELQRRCSNLDLN